MYKLLDVEQGRRYQTNAWVHVCQEGSLVTKIRTVLNFANAEIMSFLFSGS